MPSLGSYRYGYWMVLVVLLWSVHRSSQETQDSDPDDCIVVSVPCKVGDKYPVTGKCNSYSKCEQRGQKVRLKTKSCGSRIYDHEDEKCVDASSEKRQEICYAPDRQFCANTTTTAWPTATSTATTSTTSTMMSTKYTTAPSRNDRTDDVSTTSNQSGTTTEEPLPDDKQTTGTSSNSVLKNPTVLATIIAVAGVIVISAIIAITVICIRRRKQGGSDTGFPRKTLIQSISTNTEEAIYSEIAEVPPVPPPRPNLTPNSSAASEGQPILRTNSLYDAPAGMSNPNYHPAYIEVLPSAPEEPGNEGIDNEAYNYTYPRNPVSVLEALRGQEAPPTGDNDSPPTGGADAVSL